MIPVVAIYMGESLRDLKNKSLYLGFALFSAVAITLFSIWYFTSGIEELPTYWDVAIVTVPLDFNHDIKKFSKVYEMPAPIVVIGTKKVNEGSITIWYMRKRSGRYRTLDDFLMEANTIERGTYLIYYKDYTEALMGLYDSFTELQKGKIWNIGIVR
jgi:hypothetical protein